VIAVLPFNGYYMYRSRHLWAVGSNFLLLASVLAFFSAFFKLLDTLVHSLKDVNGGRYSTAIESYYWNMLLKI
jgi:hypothetical protein